MEEKKKKSSGGIQRRTGHIVHRHVPRQRKKVTKYMQLVPIRVVSAKNN